MCIGSSKTLSPTINGFEMMLLSPDTVEVAPENTCDICQDKDAKYYNIRYYIHLCSDKCFEEFIAGYNREIEEIARRRLAPDETKERKKE